MCWFHFIPHRKITGRTTGQMIEKQIGQPLEWWMIWVPSSKRKTFYVAISRISRWAPRICGHVQNVNAVLFSSSFFWLAVGFCGRRFIRVHSRNRISRIAAQFFRVCDYTHFFFGWLHSRANKTGFTFLLLFFFCSVFLFMGDNAIFKMNTPGNAITIWSKRKCKFFRDGHWLVNILSIFVQ